MNTAQINELLQRVADPALDVDARCAAGDALGRLGDPRLADEPLVTIPAGILHHKDSPEADVAERPMNAFRIQRHLVTVADYADFVDEEGYQDPALWSADGWRWRLDQDIEQPRFWGEDEWRDYLVPNHPVVGVSAFEAEAYAAFRGLRLPTQDEWERACRGDDDRDFPWGPEWDDHACGHRDYGPRCTKPIGVFPRGVSPFGIHDLVGSVWQWTSDRSGAAKGYGRAHVVRGGAWNNLPWSIGSAGRNAYPPDAQFSNLGFRCADSA
ncbi:MAG: SUMF1/EgtB/PvdO family nonheme iron enzyme [Polyangiaceae bacterium]